MDESKIEKRREHEKITVAKMIEIYCHGNHETKESARCPFCEDLKAYAAARTDYCPHMADKTFCLNCKTHCYKPDMREKIRQVMRYSGPRMILHSPLLCIKHGWYKLWS